MSLFISIFLNKVKYLFSIYLFSYLYMCFAGRRKIAQLKDNANYFRQKLVEMGLHVIGQNDSPIIPVMLLQPTKIAAFSRECFERGLAVVVHSIYTLFYTLIIIIILIILIIFIPYFIFYFLFHLI